MGSNAEAFGKGGCGCLMAFFLLGFFALLVGGHFHIDLGGAILLFVMGGLLGLVVNAIYSKGKRDAFRIGESGLDPRHQNRGRCEPYECPLCNHVSDFKTAQGNCPNCGAPL